MKLLCRCLFFFLIPIAFISVINAWKLARTAHSLHAAPLCTTQTLWAVSRSLQWALTWMTRIITSSSSYTRRMRVVLIGIFFLSYWLRFARQISPWYIKASCCCSLHSTLTALIALWLGNTHAGFRAQTTLEELSFFHKRSTFSWLTLIIYYLFSFIIKARKLLWLLFR